MLILITHGFELDEKLIALRTMRYLAIFNVVCFFSHTTEVIMISDSLAFISQLIMATFSQIKDFLFFFFFQLATFAVIMMLINDNLRWHPTIENEFGVPIDNHGEGRTLFDAIKQQFLISMGDWHLDHVPLREDYHVYVILVFIQIIVSAIIMLNLLIAIISDVFDRESENKQVNSLKGKLTLVECYFLKAKNKYHSFRDRPFLFTVKTKKQHGQSNDDWDGKIKAIQKATSERQKKLESKITGFTIEMRKHNSNVSTCLGNIAHNI